MQTEEQVIQLREDEQIEPEGEVPDEQEQATAEAFAGVEEIVVPEGMPVADAFALAAEALDADKAGDAARPQYQPSIPGIRPPFDWRRAQLATESLEESVASAERIWEAAKKETSKAKSEFDDAVEALRNHIQETHRERVDAEFQNRTAAEGAPAPADAVNAAACAFERTTGKPCPICRNPVDGVTPADNTIVAHVASAAVTSQANNHLEALGLRDVIREVAGVELHDDTVRGWSAVERAQVLAHLEMPGVVDRPPHLGTAHEAADHAAPNKQACRICGAPMPFLPPEDDHWPIGQKVGVDCLGEPGSDLARAPKATHTDKAKAKRSRKKDHAAEQKAEGAQKAADEEPVSGGKKKTTRKKAGK